MIPKLVAIVLAFSNICSATTVVVLITPQAIVLGSDGKEVGTRVRTVHKTIIFKKRIVIACLGKANFEVSDNDGSLTFNFNQWIADVEKQYSGNVTVADVTMFLKSKSSVALQSLNRFIREGKVDFQKPQKNFLDFVIAGYDSGVPTINQVKFQIDWDKNSVNQTVANDHPRADTRVDFDFFILGSSNFNVNDVKDRESQGYKEMAAFIPHVLPKLAAMKPLTNDEASSTCLAVLRIEAKHFDDVGPPYLITINVPLGAGNTVQILYRK